MCVCARLIASLLHSTALPVRDGKNNGCKHKGAARPPVTRR